MATRCAVFCGVVWRGRFGLSSLSLKLCRLSRSLSSLVSFFCLFLSCPPPLSLSKCSCLLSWFLSTLPYTPLLNSPQHCSLASGLSSRHSKRSHPSLVDSNRFAKSVPRRPINEADPATGAGCCATASRNDGLLNIIRG